MFYTKPFFNHLLSIKFRRIVKYSLIVGFWVALFALVHAVTESFYFEENFLKDLDIYLCLFYEIFNAILKFVVLMTGYYSEYIYYIIIWNTKVENPLTS